jgi:hexosaminidase
MTTSTFLRGLTGLLVLVLAGLLPSACRTAVPVAPKPVALVPAPTMLTMRPGGLRFSTVLSIEVVGVSERDRSRLLAACRETLGLVPAVAAGAPGLCLIVTPAATVNPEAYELTIAEDGITIRASSAAGVFYGLMSLRQWLPAERLPAGQNVQLACLQINDQPRFGWRGMHLDVSRHFFTVEQVKRYIDRMSWYKLNTFHWHLSDDQGWRLASPAYPRLTTVGAWRAARSGTDWNQFTSQQPGEAATYGGFYTREQIREVVAYAADRYITIVPEIDMPGHSRAAISAYPELSCSGLPVPVATGGDGINGRSSLCPGKDSTLRFATRILDELIELFPSRFIHVGGDECDKSPWNACPACARRLQEEQLKDVDGLQSWFIRQLDAHLAAKGRRLVGWDEILEGGLAPGAVVMSWRGQEGGRKAAEQGHDVVMAPGELTYFDHYQSHADSEPPAFPALARLSQTYAFDPIPPGLPADARHHVLGGEGCLWTEFILTEAQTQYMTLPRLIALAERVWSGSGHSFRDFVGRLEPEMLRLEKQGIHCSRSAWLAIPEPVSSSPGMVRLVLRSEIAGLEYRYTLDGSEPGPDSSRFVTGMPPILIKSFASLRAVPFRDGKPQAPVIRQDFRFHQAIGSVISGTPPSPQYPGCGGLRTLADAFRGNHIYGTQNWLGWDTADPELRIDFATAVNLHEVRIGSLQDSPSWIELPARLEVSTSADGQTFALASEQQPAATAKPRQGRQDIVAAFSPRLVKSLRIKAKRAILPPGHNGAGRPAWIFFDEIEAW